MKINYEARFPIKSFLKDKIKKTVIKKRHKKQSSQPVKLMTRVIRR
jgi:hypothetical protein